jgi:hypothetical protein
MTLRTAGLAAVAMIAFAANSLLCRAALSAREAPGPEAQQVLEGDGRRQPPSRWRSWSRTLDEDAARALLEASKAGTKVLVATSGATIRSIGATPRP